MVVKFYCVKCKKLQLEEAIANNDGYCPNCGDDMSETYNGKSDTIEVTVTQKVITK